MDDTEHDNGTTGGGGGGGGTPPATPPSSPPTYYSGNANARYLTRDADAQGEGSEQTATSSLSLDAHRLEDAQRMDTSEDGPPGTPQSPQSPTSVLSVSASAVSATDQPGRYGFAEVSASIDATPMPRYLGHYGGPNAPGMGYGDGDQEEDDVEAELRRMAQRQVPRGDLGRSEWRLDGFQPAASQRSMADGTPVSPSQSVRSMANDRDAALPRPPASPPSSPRSTASSARMRDATEYSPMTAPSATGAPESEQNLSGAVVWGTNISLADSMGLFRSFVQQFQLPTHDSAAPTSRREEAHYIKVLRHLHLTQSLIFNLDTQHLLQFRPARKLYNQLVLFPQVLIRVLDMVVYEEFKSLFPEATEEESRIQVRPFNLSDLAPMRNLNPSDIDQLVCMKGMVTRVSSIIPDLKEAFFRCTICHQTAQVELDRGRIEEPTFCQRCNTRHCMEMIHNRCVFTDKQMVKMQETPDAIPEGETPYTVMLFAFDDLVDDVRPGDKVEITGIYRAVPLRSSSRQRVVKSVFKTYVDVVHFRRVDELSRRETGGASDFAVVRDSDAVDDAFSNDPHRLHASEQAKLEEFRRIAAHPNAYENLAHSLAPSIWELDDVKKGILCMLFGGTRKERTANGHVAALADDENSGGSAPKKTLRSDMNVLLCGDPGTSKSQLLSYVHKLSPRSIYTSGKGSSAVGLTASVVRDMETGDLVLESGALVLSDEGICCIDEFDKMSDSARSVLHEVMEQQTVSIAKAGIICSLNARASILASANPIESRYNPNKSVIENVNIVPTLLSRFDLIYLILDKPQPDTDRKLAKHLVALYYDDKTRQERQNTRGECQPQLISMKLLTEYISYAKKNIRPKLSPEARDELVRSYLDLRRMGGAHSSKKNITATPRQLESLIRISEALAKMKLCEVVSRNDVIEAARLMNVATQRTAMDPRTGTIDMDMITTGRGASEREAITDMVEGLKAILADAPNQTMAVGEARGQLEDKRKMAVKGNEVQAALRSLEDDDLIQISQGKIKYFGPTDGSGYSEG
ncbi:TPA: hypothetical protein N0F65_001081 [Lagenidium giganteum]|uniref:DNA helicase n=1 Tax=Lagenidium giganteum TaxID=4803 RepID=A0AAV2YFD3_9STRA|nr:TPA: hypothetical protein N0F65_011501 [Lagenidium giganteum]DAZ93946.1 TPA: hypothetical protein N0F65_001081 [Lagenidium giganteum]